MEHFQPDLVLLFCGKRKSGKDYLTEQLQRLLPENQSVIIRVSGPLKKCYAQDHGLDYENLMSASDYKEKHRLEMIKWSEKIRNEDYGYFCRAALKMYDAEKFRIWILSDCRRKTDFRFFKEKFGSKCRTVRVFASEETRTRRGFVFQDGVDNAESECGLDDITDFDHVIQNEGDSPPELLLEKLLSEAKSAYK